MLKNELPNEPAGTTQSLLKQVDKSGKLVKKVTKPSLNNILNEAGKTTLVILLLAPVLAEVCLLLFNDFNLSNWMFPGLLYATWLAYISYFILRINLIILKNTSRHTTYIQLAFTHKYLNIAYYIFPLPFLAIYGFWHSRRMRKLRTEPYACEKCDHSMRLLDDKEDNVYLQKAQSLEENIKSVDYDVWICENCRHELVLDYENLYSKMEPCPQCKSKTLEEINRKEVQSPTTSVKGWGWRYCPCRSCNFETKLHYTIAKLPESDSSGSSSSFGSSGSSSSGSSSGGSSGGGGAGSSW